MHDDWSVLRVRMVVHHVPHPPPELEQRVGERIGVARPLGVVEQHHCTLLVVLRVADEEYVEYVTLSELLTCRNTFLIVIVLIMKFASCSSFSTVTPTPL